MTATQRGALRVVLAAAAVALGAAAAAAWFARAPVPAPAPPAPAPAPAAGSVLQGVYRERVSAAKVAAAARPLFAGFAAPEVRFDVDAYELLYSSRDFDGAAIVVRAQLFVPVAAAEDASPLFVFGSGTTGNADQCAPSLEQLEARTWGHYRAYMLAHAGAGFAGVLPDYAGFNDPQAPQRYFSKKAEAHVMLDAARAAKAFLGANPRAGKLSGAVFVAGYSQGGHAALAAADLNAEYAPDVELSGVVGFAAAADVADLFRDGPKYAPYVIHSWSRIYGRERVDPAEYLQQRWASTLEADAARMCVEEFQLYYPADGKQLFTKTFYDALHGGTLDRDFPAMASLLADNAAGTRTGRLPVLLIQGGADTIVSVAAGDRCAERLRGAGTPVTYLVLDGVPHKHTRAAGFGAAVGWMRQIARGESPLPDNRRL